jgi:stage II sporulation protein GA (sporulation sigma-E factor processing peptidase)
MEYEIYADVLFLINLIIDTMLLCATAFLLKKEIKKMRLLMASIFGALYSVVIFFIEMNTLLSFVLHILISVIMIKILFGKAKVKVLLKNTLTFIIISFIFGGCVIALYNFTPFSEIIAISNGVSYLNVSFFSLIIICVLSYLLIIFLSKSLSSSNLNTYLSKVEIYFNNNTVKLNGFTDTGNSLTDNLTGIPVVIAEFNAVKELIPMEMHSFFNGNYESELKCELKCKIRLIPYKGIWENSGLLACFKPDFLRATASNRKAYKSNVLVGVVNDSLSLTGEYSILLHPDIFINEG